METAHISDWLYGKWTHFLSLALSLSLGFKKRTQSFILFVLFDDCLRYNVHAQQLMFLSVLVTLPEFPWEFHNIFECKLVTSFERAR